MTTGADTSLKRAATGGGGPQHVQVAPHVVDALVMLLTHRNAPTAAHSREVADLACALGRGLLPDQEQPILDAAGKLHDIGKLAMPDELLLKPTFLDPMEWEGVREYAWLGVNLVSAVLRCPPVSAILARHATWLAGTAAVSDLGDDVSSADLAPRILAVADAFSAMTADHPYRAARTVEDALCELRSAPGRFDFGIVQRLAAHVTGAEEDGDSN